MSACPDKALLLHAAADGELDVATALALDAHVGGCAACRDEQAQIVAMRQLLAEARPHHAAPEALRLRIGALIDQSSAAPGHARSTTHRAARWFAGGAITALAASVALFVSLPQFSAHALDDQLIAGHVRSLLAAHLTDVAASDKHVVRPWFNGKIDFAPPVVDLKDQGFPLAGGRLDYLDGAVVPALVYHRRLHSINLFIRRDRGGGIGATFVTVRNGYSLARWSDGGLQFFAVSDIPAPEFNLFRLLFRGRTAAGAQR